MMKYDLFHYLMIDQYDSGWYLCWPDCSKFSGPYKRAQDAKGELTKLLKGNSYAS